MMVVGTVDASSKFLTPVIRSYVRCILVYGICEEIQKEKNVGETKITLPQLAPMCIQGALLNNNRITGLKRIFFFILLSDIFKDRFFFKGTMLTYKVHICIIYCLNCIRVLRYTVNCAQMKMTP